MIHKYVPRVAAILAVSVLSATVALAAPGDKSKSKAPTCSVCKMTLTAKKDKTHTKAVKIGKKTYYCCAACKMK